MDSYLEYKKIASKLNMHVKIFFAEEGGRQVGEFKKWSRALDLGAMCVFQPCRGPLLKVTIGKKWNCIPSML